MWVVIAPFGFHVYNLKIRRRRTQRGAVLCLIQVWYHQWISPRKILFIWLQVLITEDLIWRKWEFKTTASSLFDNKTFSLREGFSPFQNQNLCASTYYIPRPERESISWYLRVLRNNNSKASKRDGKCSAFFFFFTTIFIPPKDKLRILKVSFISWGCEDGVVLSLPVTLQLGRIHHVQVSLPPLPPFSLFLFSIPFPFALRLFVCEIRWNRIPLVKVLGVGITSHYYYYYYFPIGFYILEIL